jgi:hypothetical protein
MEGGGTEEAAGAFRLQHRLLLVVSMQLLDTAEVAVAIGLIAVVWAAGAAWIKVCDYVAARQALMKRWRTRQSLRSASPRR